MKLNQVAIAVMLGVFVSAVSVCAGAQSQRKAPIGPGNIIVHSALGGFILGYDIDQTGTEGILSEAVALADGKANVAVETFDQKTGKTIKILSQQSDSKNDFVTLGIFGNHVALTEFEHVTDLFVDKRLYGVSNPLNSNRITGKWTPPFKKADDIISSMSASQGFSNAAVLGFQNTVNNFSSYVFSSNVAANTFGPVFKVSDPVFNFDNSPVLAFNSTTNQAVLGGSNGCFGCTTEIGMVDLTTGKLTEFEGLGFGFINGIAVDSATGIACTTTEDDFSVEFYDLAKQTGIIVVLPGANNQAQSGGAVAVDPIHKLFLIGQEFSSTAPSGSSIQVFDEQGNFVESLNGFDLPASAAYMALHPSERAGYVIVTPELTTLQSFTY
ncbi:MAG TPA: hypothetical protein VK763_05175 [Terriglobales bacterium]|jgi:hypothetical protein|nr:hypothetical protein [Terriglobales bacterium]